jgi:hypothetical protein
LSLRLREGLIEFLRRNHPESLPTVRNLNVEIDGSSEIHRRKPKSERCRSNEAH